MSLRPRCGRRNPHEGDRDQREPPQGVEPSTLVDEALEGARSKGAETERVDLYDLDFMGCRSCFACKRVGLEDHRCTYRDGLTPVLERVREADALVLGTPIYLYQTTAGFAAFMERLLFPEVTYRKDLSTFCERPVPTAFIYTMNAGEDYIEEMRRSYGRYEQLTANLLRSVPESYDSVNTWQYSDYDRFEHSAFDVESKRVLRERVFPVDRENCRRMGERLVDRIER